MHVIEPKERSLNEGPLVYTCVFEMKCRRKKNGLDAMKQGQQRSVEIVGGFPFNMLPSRGAMFRNQRKLRCFPAKLPRSPKASLMKSWKCVVNLHGQIHIRGTPTHEKQEFVSPKLLF